MIGVAFDSAPTNQTIFSMPNGYKPVGDVELAASGGGSYNAKAQVRIDGDTGAVKVTSVDKWVYAYGVYIATV
jgi:hypothetical protein